MEPLRILHVVTWMNLGGIETLLMSLYRNIDRKKIQFDFLLHRTEKGVFDDEIRKLGGRIYYQQPLNPMKYFTYRKRLKFFFKKHREYSIVHSHMNANSSIVLDIAKKCNVSVRIAHAHSDRVVGHKSVLKNILRKYVAKVATDCFACSRQAGRWLFGENKSFNFFANGIEINRFSYNEKNRCGIREELNVDKNTIIIGHIGNFSRLKNHSFIIEIYASFEKENENSILLLLGDGDLRVEIKQKVKDLNLENKVIFLGNVVNANKYLNAMDCFIFPSLFEGLGIVLIEAQCNGLPILMNESLPLEAELTDLVTKLSLKTDALTWAKELNKIIKMKYQYNRDQYCNIVKASNFNISTQVEFLQNFYLDSVG